MKLSLKQLKKFYHNKNILVTGGLGFIGSNLSRRLANLGSKVTIIDSLIPKYGGNLYNLKGFEKQVTVNISDVRDQFSMDALIQNRDIIFNLAGSLSHIDSMKDPFTDLDINCRSQLSILESCRRYNSNVKIVYAGTRNQYGRAKTLPVDEKHPMEPTDVNGINCIAGEWYHILYNNVYDIRTCSLRLSNTYGPRHQMKHSRQGVLNWFIRQIIEGETINLFGGGDQIRDCIYISDIVDAFVRIGASEKVWGQAYNLGGCPTSLKNFVKQAIKIYGKGKFVITKFPQGRKKIEIGDFIADYQKITRAVSWKPRINLATGIKRTFAFYEKNKKHYWD